jgi:hypothetical protein
MSTRSILRITGLAATLCGTFIFLAACGSADNANLANTVGTGNVNTALPPGFSTTPVNVNGPIPGIPDAGNANIQIKPGASPIPGIDPKNVNVKPRAGAAPTPGIPSPEELRRQMQSQGTGTAADSPSMMRSNSAPSMMRSNTNGPRTTRKP